MTIISHGGRRITMKKDAKPIYIDSTVTCACGNTFKVKSTKPEIHVEVCNQCHPFYTGKQGAVVKAGRVEKFNKKYAQNKEAK